MTFHKIVFYHFSTIAVISMCLLFDSKRIFCLNFVDAQLISSYKLIEVSSSSAFIAYKLRATSFNVVF